MFVQALTEDTLSAFHFPSKKITELIRNSILTSRLLARLGYTTLYELWTCFDGVAGGCVSVCVRLPIRGITSCTSDVPARCAIMDLVFLTASKTVFLGQ